jgi:hypothetical protein
MAMTLPFRGRRVNAELARGATLDPVDAYVGSAYWLDTLADLDDAELEALTAECAGEIEDAFRLRLAEGDFSPWTED